MRQMNRRPTHPGEILKENYLATLGLTVTRAALILGVSRKTLSKILNGRGDVTAEMALRLSRAFETTPELWLNLQRNVDLWEASNRSDDWRNVKPVAS